MISTIQSWLDRTYLRRAVSTIRNEVADVRRLVTVDLPLGLDDRLAQTERIIMSALDDLQAAAERNGAAVGEAVTALADQRAKIAALEQAVTSGQLDQEKLAAITASIDAESDKIAQALAPVVSDPATPTPVPDSNVPVETPPAQNPDTADPSSVDGAAAAGEPLPDDLLA